ncbi:VF530 family protein [Aquabacterium sp.]|uniref:VF530 family protein n=1 Tax=Aquabacterium sp. TaxID=1872578 RepID=UPI0024875565|nr:VF530 family protein [Aquabacterium sp.]MDI1348390.1 VF530 family protein [Aquabacterium sp.]
MGGGSEQPGNPLHGITLARMVEDLADFYGWEELGRLIPVRCFTHEPSVASSLKFLRRTPWAREKVEALYVDSLRRYGGTHGGAQGSN